MAADGSRSIAMVRAADGPQVICMLAAADGSRSIAMRRTADGLRVTAVFGAALLRAALSMPAQRRERHMTLGDGAVGGAQPYDVAGQNGLCGPVPVGEPP
jgi:hypothetical protein